MSKHSRNEEITVRVIRNGEPEPPDDYWSKATMEERIEGVWILTRLCIEWNNPSGSVPEFQKTVTRLIRK